jgi:hypothetical protein
MSNLWYFLRGAKIKEGIELQELMDSKMRDYHKMAEEIEAMGLSQNDFIICVGALFRSSMIEMAKELKKGVR